ncbi:DUF4209 domain-containing protein [Lysobacter sp. K5869]|uniref:DUF4209 domain-containing protein n=1 Tax=Lysobacter sp. K5869 TaxID=2820808 RepID=UPI001C063EA3|nr:DUF4209 domain-containing protein [Lysobacter sp. K5869]QWP78708.1 DUF4209 domain-containing protein [Lysobacter sp. K5869]
MAILTRPVSEETLSAMDWQQYVLELDWSEYSIDSRFRLMPQIEQLQARDETLAAEVLTLLGHVATLVMEPRASFPFRIRSVQKKNGLDSLDQYDIECLAMMALQANDPWLRARLADVAVTAGRDRGLNQWQLGSTAVHAYLDHCEQHLLGEQGFLHTDEAIRGTRLRWVYAKRDEATYERYKQLIISGIRRGLELRHPGLYHALARDIIAQRYSFSAEVAPILEQAANQFATDENCDYDLASRAYLLAYKLWEVAGNKASANRCHLAAGQALVTRSRGTGSAMLRSDWLAEGIQLLRQARSPRQHITALWQELSDLRMGIESEMHEHEFSVDVTDIAEAARAAITGPTAWEALLQLGFLLGNWYDPGMIRQEAIESAQRFVFRSFFTQVHLDRSGNPIDREDAFDINNEEHVTRRMVAYLLEHRLDFFSKVIAPNALEVMTASHPPSFELFLEAAYLSPTAPKGHEYSLARGLYAGCTSDWHECGTYLIPQVEPFVRNLLKRAGRNTLTVGDDGIEKERTLGDMLISQDAAEILGSRLVLELRALMTESSGYRLRNNYAHGLFNDAELENVGVVRLWWTTLRLVMFPWGREYLASLNQAV